MSNSYDGFQSRLNTLDWKRAKLAHGYHGTVNQDGLVVFRPVRQHRGIPLRSVMLLIVGLFIFKGLVMAHAGTALYDDRIAKLQNGTMIEQMGAFVMQSDPVSSRIAQQLRPILK